MKKFVILAICIVCLLSGCKKEERVLNDIEKETASQENLLVNNIENTQYNFISLDSLINNFDYEEIRNGAEEALYNDKISTIKYSENILEIDDEKLEIFSGDSIYWGISIIDLNKNDEYKEVVFPIPGCPLLYDIYRYDGEKIIYVGTIEESPYMRTFVDTSNGIIVQSYDFLTNESAKIYWNIENNKLNVTKNNILEKEHVVEKEYKDEWVRISDNLNYDGYSNYDIGEAIHFKLGDRFKILGVDGLKMIMELNGEKKAIYLNP